MYRSKAIDSTQSTQSKSWETNALHVPKEQDNTQSINKTSFIHHGSN